VHGFGMGTPATNFSGFRAAQLHRELGLNLMFPTLPLHGPRGIGRMSGSTLLSPDYTRMLHAFSQAVWDVRRCVRWANERGQGQPVALYGLSLGGYTSALVSALENDLACVIAGVPPTDFPNVARDNEPVLVKNSDPEHKIDWQVVRELSHVVSPLSLDPLVPRERRFIYAGIADRVVRPDQARALWRHWGRPSIHWYDGGHVMGQFNPTVYAFVREALERSGALPDLALFETSSSRFQRPAASKSSRKDSSRASRRRARSGTRSKSALRPKQSLPS
jgi:hypothetical protein